MGDMDLLSRVQRLEAAGKARSATRKQLKDDIAAEVSVIPVPPRQTTTVPKRARTSAKGVIQEAQLSLFHMEAEGRFQIEPINPQSEYPRFLTRIPIFLPGRRSKQHELHDKDNAIAFDTSWGRGRKHGPPLTTYDEDTLIALARLRQYRLHGRSNSFPIQVSQVLRYTKEHDDVHVLHCQISDIQRILGIKEGGRNNELRLDSVKRLGNTSIEVDDVTAKKLKLVSHGTSFKILDYAWETWGSDDACLYIQFPPVMTQWLDKEYTYITLDVRRQLTETGKALHRFFSGQSKDYSIHTKKLMTVIGFIRGYNKFMEAIRRDLEQMTTMGWIESWKIEGNGRTIPHKLTIYRA